VAGEPARDAILAPSPATLARNVPATRALLRRETCVHSNHRARSTFSLRDDHLIEETKPRVQHDAIEAGFRRHVAAGFLRRAQRKKPLSERQHVCACDLVLSRDQNAARVNLLWALAQTGREPTGCLAQSV
jgi:hypothetical protein